MTKPQHYENYYEDIAVYAIPIRQDRPGTPNISYSPEVTVNAKGVYCADKPAGFSTFSINLHWFRILR